MRPDPSFRQKRFEPQREQKPRSAEGEERYQASVSLSINVSASAGAPVAATWWPVVFRHCEQWQATTGRSGPLTSYFTPPQRQEPR